MTDVLTPAKPLSVSPLKVSQPVGASLAFLGLARTMPLEHGARGCTSFNKLFFMRHFREPIALQTTAMEQTTTVLGADGNVVEALRTIAERTRPEIVGLISTGLSEMQGADIPRTVKAFCAEHPQHVGMAVVPVGATDTLGCLETGFALAVEAIVEALVPEGRESGHRPRQVNVLAPAMLTPGDVEALKEWVEAFGLEPIVLPDLADSLDGHLTPEGYSPLTYGGTTRAAIARMGQSAATLVIGRSLGRAADRLKERTGVPDHRFDGLMGLDACDAFTDTLATLSGRPVPARVERWRDQLRDAMVDCQFQLGAARAAIAADADLLASLAAALAAAGVQVTAAVATARAPVLDTLPTDVAVVGDLEDLETLAREHGADVLIANAHGVETAARLGVPLVRAGFPLYDSFGAAARCWIGYRGSRNTLFDLANTLAAAWREIPPYRSVYWQGTPRAAEVPNEGGHQR
ncbi:nitrogenase iron-molybdenum cofactor biosynthesis protein NifN [Azospirillum sp. TSO22-1]|uniref:nitrogenase iron-molybdenum cofactor biosynthesis protein NifN n=1 Tax=Azospirillum sp. TSO22-1 TaxID=716789 RepID=UPI000D61F9FC|nr:nitrogenase iron-molybdenum cofactor biosynthesis protein NifN [Azospirillum sp. TSO22-1]PWC42389.1 nitrogen fixation protein NifN [Azospirillum sp. TSO22-1]